MTAWHLTGMHLSALVPGQLFPKLFNDAVKRDRNLVLGRHVPEDRGPGLHLLFANNERERRAVFVRLLHLALQARSRVVRFYPDCFIAQGMDDRKGKSDRIFAE